jgi:peptide/nickel transport system ATP-binding protein
MRVGRLLAEPLRLHLRLRGDRLRERSVALLEEVGIPDPESSLRRFPHEFSGGQQQRIALAIAMACRPRVLLLDEPTTGLDVTTQAQIAALIAALVRESAAAALMISHDLALLSTVCDELSIMYGGEIVEQGPAQSVHDGPRHPYSAALIDAVPRVDDAALRVGIPGMPPPRVIEHACAFADRCRFATDGCRATHPPLRQLAEGRAVRCLRADDLGVIGAQRGVTERRPVATLSSTALLAVEDLRCSYRAARGRPAVDGVSFALERGETLALVGASGSGKSTALLAIAGLHVPDSGTVRFRGECLRPRAVQRDREICRAIQIVFQDPHASLNPRHTVATIIERPVRMFAGDLSRARRQNRVLELLTDVQLDADLLMRYPHQLSGGQKQRVALARAFAAEPNLILCDEVVSALDVSVQAQVLALLARLAAEHGTALLFVTHDLAVARSLADRVAVMRAGRILEIGVADAIFERPADEYTRAVLRRAARPLTSTAR